jgi:excisionase family DNA binding protein
VAELPEWVSVSEAERLTGLSARTIKRMAAEGQLRCSHSPGNHMRVLRADVDRLLRRESPASGSASSILQNKREKVEELSLELQETRARREIRKLSEEDAEAERRRADVQRAQDLANKRALDETRLQAAREAERREREQREAETQRQRAAFRRRWVTWATDRFPAWLSFEQRQIGLAAVEEMISARDLEDAGLMPRLLGDAISRICAPWDLERQARQKREGLVERAIRWDLPSPATDADKAQAAAGIRSALAQVPLTAGDTELRAAVSGAVESIVKAIEGRKAAELAKQAAERQKEKQRVEAERAQEAQRRAGEERAAKARLDSAVREGRKRNLIAVGVAHVSNHVFKLFCEDEITRDAWLDFEWRRELEKEVRDALESELTGAVDESEQDAKQIAEEVVDGVLE